MGLKIYEHWEVSNGCSLYECDSRQPFDYDRNPISQITYIAKSWEEAQQIHHNMHNWGYYEQF